MLMLTLGWTSVSGILIGEITFEKVWPARLHTLTPWTYSLQAQEIPA